MNAVRLSVIIPCYNAERYIGATIESVLAQDQAGMEIIVVDDGSSDGSVELVRRKYPSVRLEQQANAGVAAARNKGLALAQGEWVAFVDADDIWLPGKLAAQFALMSTDPACRMSYTAWQVWPSAAVLPTGETLARLDAVADDVARWGGASGWIYPELLLDCVVWTSTVLAKRSLFEETGGFDPTLRIGEDYDLWLRASRVTPILRVPRPYALYRMHPDSITRSMPTDNYRARVIGRALEKWGMRSPDGREADHGAVQGMMAKSWSDFAGAHLSGGNVGHARRAGWKSLRTDFTHVPGWKVLVKSCLRGLMPPVHAQRTNKK